MYPENVVCIFSFWSKWIKMYLLVEVNHFEIENWKFKGKKNNRRCGTCMKSDKFSHNALICSERDMYTWNSNFWYSPKIAFDNYCRVYCFCSPNFSLRSILLTDYLCSENYIYTNQLDGVRCEERMRKSSNVYIE